MTVIDLLGGAVLHRWCLRSQYWPRQRLEAYVQERTRRTLQSALRIPFYRSRLGDRLGDGGQVKEWTDLPILRRSEVPELNQSVRSLHPPGRKFVEGYSSGSTGMPVEFLFSDGHQRSRFAARLRYLGENGWSPAARSLWIIIFPEQGPDHELVRLSRLSGMRFLSAYTDFEEQVRCIRRLKPSFLYTYPTNLEGLLAVLQKDGGLDPPLRRILTGAEALDDVLRQRVKTVLGVDISDNYGSTEAFPAWECPAGRYHINAEHVLVEVVDDSGRPVPSGVMGKVLVTTLHNELMPLVRYEIGDYAVASDGLCPCGRTLPLLSRIVGRGINLFRTRDGRLRSPWEALVEIKYRPEFQQYQVIQKALDRYLIRFVSTSDLTVASREAIAGRFREVLGDVSVEFERVQRIERAASGKYMVTLSELDPDVADVL